MAWTVEDLRDLAELLRAHPEWREPLWALLASEEVRRMPERMEQGFRRAARLILALYRAQRRTEESLRRLAETFAAHRQEFLAHQAQTNARLEELSTAVRNLTETVHHLTETVHHLSEIVDNLAQTQLGLAEAQRRTEESLQRLAEAFVAHRQEFLAHQAQTNARFEELSASVGALTETVHALAEVQRRTEESLAAHRAETDRRFAELAEAQRRHYEEFVAHRAETDRRFAELSAEVRALAEAQRRTEESLAAHRAETDRRFAELAEAQRRTEEILQQVLLRQEQFQRTLDHFGQIIGPITEEHMVQALQEWIAQQGGTLLSPVVSITLDGLGEVDGLARARLPDGREAWLLVSAKAKVWARSITEFVERILRHPEARERLQAQGVGDPVLPVVFGRALDHRALEAAQRARVGLLIGRQGMLVPPTLWSLSEGKPLG